MSPSTRSSSLLFLTTLLLLLTLLPLPTSAKFSPVFWRGNPRSNTREHLKVLEERQKPITATTRVTVWQTATHTVWVPAAAVTGTEVPVPAPTNVAGGGEEGTRTESWSVNGTESTAAGSAVETEGVSASASASSSLWSSVEVEATSTWSAALPNATAPVSVDGVNSTSTVIGTDGVSSVISTIFETATATRTATSTYIPASMPTISAPESSASSNASAEESHSASTSASASATDSLSVEATATEAASSSVYQPGNNAPGSVPNYPTGSSVSINATEATSTATAEASLNATATDVATDASVSATSAGSSAEATPSAYVPGNNAPGSVPNYPGESSSTSAIADATETSTVVNATETSSFVAESTAASFSAEDSSSASSAANATETSSLPVDSVTSSSAESSAVSSSAEATSSAYMPGNRPPGAVPSYPAPSSSAASSEASEPVSSTVTVDGTSTSDSSETLSGESVTASSSSSVESETAEASTSSSSSAAPTSSAYMPGNRPPGAIPSYPSPSTAVTSNASTSDVALSTASVESESTETASSTSAESTATAGISSWISSWWSSSTQTASESSATATATLSVSATSSSTSSESISAETVSVSSSATASATQSSSSPAATGSTGRSTTQLPAQIMASYYADWTAWTLPPSALDFAKLDVIDFAFAIPNAQFGLEFTQWNSADTLRTLVALANAAGKKVRVSIGGWTGSVYFSSAVATESSRQTFANNIAAMYSEYGINGIDLDWEYPGGGGAWGNQASKDDSANLLLFLRTLRATLPEAALISCATQVWPFRSDDGYTPMTDVSGFAEVLDWVLLMNYDIWGSSDTPGPNAPLSNACGNSAQPNANAYAAVSSWQSAGMPAQQILLGVPMYGYLQKSSAASLRARRRHMTEKRQSVTVTNANGGTDNGQVNFSDLVKQGALVSDGNGNFVGSGGFTREWDGCSSTPWLKSTSSGQIITYDDPQSLSLKAQFARQSGIRGVNAWEISGDYNWALTNALRSGLGL